MRSRFARVMAFSPDGRRLFTGFVRGPGIIWDLAHVVVGR
jgi:hypothetical protein